MPKIIRLINRFIDLLENKTILFSIIYHFLLTLIIFLPCLLNGDVFIGSEDNYTHHFANLFFNLKSAQNGDLGLWNPYIYGGTNFSASTHNFIFYPFNWILFLFPKEIFLKVLTFRIFLETWAIGFFGFLMFKSEIKSVRWALFASTIYLLGGNTVLGLTIFADLTVTLWVTVGAYLIFSMSKRTLLKTFLYLTFAVMCMHFCFNIVYSLAGAVILLILFIYKFFDEYLKHTSRWKIAVTFLSAIIAGTMISMIKLFPVFYRIVFEGTRITHTNFEPLQNGILFSLSAFVPETFGVQMNQSLAYLTQLGGKPVSSHVETYSYFGVLPILFVFYSFFNIQNRKFLFWSIYFSVVSLWFLNIHPVVDIINKLTYPLVHAIIPKIMIPIPLCMLAGLTAERIENGEFRLNKKTTSLTVIFSGCVLAGIIFYAFLSRHFSQQTLVLILSGLSLAIILVNILIFLSPFILRWAASCLPYFTLSLSFLILRFLDNVIDNIGMRNLTISLLLFSVLWIICDLIFVQKYRRVRLILGILTSIATAIFVQHVGPASYIKELGTHDQIPFCILGILQFLIFISLALYAYHQLSAANLLQRNFFIICLVILLFDLIPFIKTYLYVVIQKPFIQSDIIYPNIDHNLSKFDLENYRFNKPRALLGIDPKEQFTNMISIYNVRTYGGADSEVPPYQRKIFETFNEQDLLFVNGIIPASNNNRLVTLFGCAYDMDDQGKRFFRPEALSRFQLFTDYKVLHEDEDMLAQLTNPAFLPQHTVIINQQPHFNPNTLKHFTIKLKYEAIKQSHLKLENQSPFPSLLFFGDSFDPGWKATINGKSVPIMRADYKFMAIELPAGKSLVEFKFMPKTFVIGAWISLAGLLFSIVSAAVLNKFRFKTV